MSYPPRTGAVAVIGMACRLPKAGYPDAFWRLLCGGTDAVDAVPDHRWSPGGARGHDRWYGGFLDQIDQFDADFFKISPREAIDTDPQQRLALELSWEVLEDARIIPDRIRGSRTGVFVGAICDDYASVIRKRGPDGITAYTLTGTHRSIIANRISYFLDLHGPSMTIDSGQSSSLVAIHLACESLRSGESEMAIAGGVNLNLLLESTLGIARFGALSSTGRCHTFDARADGYVRGEGAGLVLLKPLSQALQDEDNIYCVVLGSAISNDGRTDGLATPNAIHQAEAIRLAHRTACVAPRDVQYVELHGTGTRVGDPIEAAALGAVFARDRDTDEPVHVGSVKTNIGHLEAAAGIAGLIKAALSIYHRQLPASLHFESPHPRIPLDDLRLRVQTRLEDWPRAGERLIAGVSAFGMGGTNCHVVLAQPPPDDTAGRVSISGINVIGQAADPPHDDRCAPAAPGVVPVVVSGRTGAALRAQAGRLDGFLAGRAGVELGGLAYSLAVTRTHFECRAVVVAGDVAGLREGLQAVAGAGAGAGTVAGVGDVSGKVVFVFPGQGSQWAGMALPLLDSSPVFRERLADCERALAPYVDWSLVEVLRGVGGGAVLDEVDVVQPVLFAVMVALAAVWRSMGVEPDAVVGHSQGEIAAACVAGALSLEDAAMVVALRSRALRRLAGRGAMAAVGLAEGELRERVGRAGGGLCVAAVNSPALGLVSGPAGEVDALVGELAGAGVFTRKLRVDYASHCGQVDVVEEEVREALAGLQPREPAVAFYSALTGGRLESPVLDADYWYRSLREPVAFAAASRCLLADGYRFFVEASPHPALVVPLAETAEEAGAAVVVTGSLRRDQGDFGCLLRSLGELHCRGLGVDWGRFFRAWQPRRVDLPTYAFQRERFWLQDRRAGADMASAGLAAAGHPLLGAAVTVADSGGLVLTGRLSLADDPWLAGHTVFGRVIVPGSVFVEFALAAADRAGLGRVEELTLEAVLALPAEGGVTVQVLAGPADESGRRPVGVHARGEDAARGVGGYVMRAGSWARLRSRLRLVWWPGRRMVPWWCRWRGFMSGCRRRVLVTGRRSGGCGRCGGGAGRFSLRWPCPRAPPPRASVCIRCCLMLRCMPRRWGSLRAARRWSCRFPGLVCRCTRPGR